MNILFYKLHFIIRILMKRHVMDYKYNSLGDIIDPTVRIKSSAKQPEEADKKTPMSSHPFLQNILQSTAYRNYGPSLLLGLDLLSAFGIQPARGARE